MHSTCACSQMPLVASHVLVLKMQQPVLCTRPQVIKNVESYPTMTDFVISTNAPEQLENWRRTNTLGVTAFRVHAAVDTVGAYGLTWAHRDVAEDALANGTQFAGGSSV